jgi:S1-C subfamily serine protease
MARYVMDQLARFGEVRRGTLGIYVQDLTGDLAGAFGVVNARGVLVAEIATESAAESAGLKAGDIITAIAGNAVGSAQEFHNYEGQFPVGEVLDLDIVRDQKPRTIRVRVAELQALEGGTLDQRLAGVLFEELPLKQRSEQVSGVLIAELEPDSRLARMGLRPGDIVVGSNRMNVRDLEEFTAVIGSVRGSLYLQVRRGRNEYVVRVD